MFYETSGTKERTTGPVFTNVRSQSLRLRLRKSITNSLATC